MLLNLNTYLLMGIGINKIDLHIKKSIYQNAKKQGIALERDI